MKNPCLHQEGHLGRRRVIPVNKTTVNEESVMVVLLTLSLGMVVYDIMLSTHFFTHGKGVPMLDWFISRGKGYNRMKLAPGCQRKSPDAKFRD